MSAMKYAILDGRAVKSVEDAVVWGRWFETHVRERIVAKTTISSVDVSTVFLGLNHAFGPGAPEWFETMIFGGPRDGECRRCETWSQAEAQHAVVVALEKAAGHG